MSGTANPEQVKIFDTTLRDGEQTPGVSFNHDTKLAIAHGLAELGVDIIEAGFPGVKQDFEVVRAIAETVDGPVVCGLARATPADIEAAAAAIEPAQHKGGSRIHTFRATSDVHMAASGDSETTVMLDTMEAVARAKQFTDDVEFSPEDATRSRPEFMKRVILEAVDSGATTINIPDTVGYTLPEEYDHLITDLKTAVDERFGAGAVTFSAHGHDDIGLATANAIAAIKAGARQVEVTMTSLGERAGNTSLEQVVAVLHERYKNKYFTNINTALLTAMAHEVSYRAGIHLQPNVAIVGNNAFAHEAGIHQQKVGKDVETYEHMRAENYGQVAGRMIIGKLSGAGGILHRMKGIGIDAPPSVARDVSTNAKELSDKAGRPLADSDIELLFAKVSAREIVDRFQLDDDGISIKEEGGVSEVEISITDSRSESHAVKSARSDKGVIAAGVKAVNEATGFEGDIEDWHGDSQQTGAEAPAGTFVIVRHNGYRVEAYAQSTSVDRASIQAYITAINLIERVNERKK